MKYGRWRMRYRLTFPIRGNGCGWEAPLQSKWDSLQPVTLFQEIALEPSSTKEKYSLAKSILRLRTNTLLRRPNSLQKNSVLLCSYARLTAYFGILPTRSPILPERDFTPSSSARGATLAVMASSVSRILPGQEYSIVTAIAAGQAYCNAPPLISQGQKRKMFLTAKKFLKLFFDTEKATRLFRSGGGTNRMLV